MCHCNQNQAGKNCQCKNDKCGCGPKCNCSHTKENKKGHEHGGHHEHNPKNGNNHNGHKHNGNK